MDQQEKLKLAQRVLWISGIFTALVALLLLLNFLQMQRHEPLESRTLEVLLERLADDPNNEALKEEIRDFDLLARKAYFTAHWQVRAGTWLLLIGGIVMAASLKIYTDLQARIERPEELSSELLRARVNTQYWLLTAGGLILGLALTSGLLTHDFLKDYGSGASLALNAAEENQAADEGIEIVELFPEAGEAAETETGAVGTETTESKAGTDAVEAGAEVSGSSETARTDSEVETAPAAKRTPFKAELLKTNQANFRGYMGLGISYHKNLPEQWNGSTGEHVKWKVEMSKPGYNSPVIWGDKLFVSGADNAGAVISCFNRSKGQLIWEEPVTGIEGSPATPPKTTDDTGLAAPTMATDGSAVYAIFGNGDIVAFSMSGQKLWGRNLGVPNNHYGHSSSLLVWEKYVVVQYDTRKGGRLLTLNVADGSIIWDVERSVQISWASPALIELNGKMQIVTTSDPLVMGHDLVSGEELWSTNAMMGEVGASVAWDGDLVFATNEYARLAAIRPGEGIIWESDEYLAEASSPVAYNGLLFTATSYGVLACFLCSNGEKVWEKEYIEGFYSSPMIADGKLYIVDLGGNCHILKADESGVEIASPELGEGAFAVPAFADGAVYLRGKNFLYGIE